MDITLCIGTSGLSVKWVCMCNAFTTVKSSFLGFLMSILLNFHRRNM